MLRPSLSPGPTLHGARLGLSVLTPLRGQLERQGQGLPSRQAMLLA